MSGTSNHHRWLFWLLAVAALALTLRFAGHGIMTALRHAHGMQ